MYFPVGYVIIHYIGVFIVSNNIENDLMSYKKGEIECGHRVLMCSGEGDFVDDFPRMLVLEMVGDKSRTVTYYHENALPVQKVINK